MDTVFKAREEFIIHAMNRGFATAANSFSQFIDKPVTISSNQSVLVHSPSGFSYVQQESGNLFVLTTQLIGALGGTSILILSEQEREIILDAGNKWNFRDYNEQFKDAMFVEIANIISASVIAELSNSLQLEIYGDVPVIYKLNASELQEFVTNRLADEQGIGGVIPGSIIMVNTVFTIDQIANIHPQFLWKLDSKIFEKVPENVLFFK